MVNPFDALLVPPALVKRALDDLHDIAQVVRRVADMEDEIRVRVESAERELTMLNARLAATETAVGPLSGQIRHMEEQLDGLAEEMAPIQELPAVRSAVEPLSGQIRHMEGQLDGLAEEMSPIQELPAVRSAVEPLAGQIGHMEQQLEDVKGELEHVAPIRHGIEPLEKSMVSVRESVDELEPMIAGLDEKIRTIEPRLEEMADSVEPIGDLAERIPGNRRRRSR